MGKTKIKPGLTAQTTKNGKLKLFLYGQPVYLNREEAMSLLEVTTNFLQERTDDVVDRAVAARTGG